MTLPRRLAPLAALALVAALAAPPRARAAAAGEADGAAGVERSVVKVFATSRQPDLSKPWAKQAPREATGSGVVIAGRRVLTNAHVVAYASQVQVQGHGTGTKVMATVEHIAHGIDLAVLKLDDESFFDTRPALALDESLPALRTPVLAYGFPTGGTGLSITKGIVSRVDFVPYQGGVFGLRVQIDAAINPGNSGGPAVVGDRLIGLANSHLGGAQNIGYIVPAEEIALFLADVADGRYDGKPALYGHLVTLENAALRRYLGLAAGVEGSVVNDPAGSDAETPLRTWDVITRIGDVPIDAEGKVAVGPGLRLAFAYLVQRQAKGGAVRLTVVREGKEQVLSVLVPPRRPQLFPPLEGGYPSYFVLGPLVFSGAVAESFGTFAGAARAARHLVEQNPLVTRLGDRPAFPGEQLVVVPSPFFPHRLAVGYDAPVGQVVKAVDGKPVRSLVHLVELLRDAQGEFLVLEFAGRGVETLVFPRKELIAATAQVLEDNGVRDQGTPDTLAAWNARPAR